MTAAGTAGKMPAPMRRLLASQAVLLALVAAGCRPPCVELAAKICACHATTTDRDTCIRQASNENSTVNPSPEEEQVCAALVDKCDCTQLGTAEGKRACGMARQ